MSSDPNADAEPVESVDTDEADVLLADPDDYHQTRRLRQIHKARENVHDTLQNIDRYTTEEQHEKQKHALGNAVAAYISELEPLMHDTGNTPDLPDSLPWTDPLAYADTLGTKQVTKEVTTRPPGRGSQPEKQTKKTTDQAHYVETMQVFRACNRFLADVKPLIEEDDSDEWEV